MKYTFLIIALFSQTVFAQQYYPLSVGNEWYFDSTYSTFNVKVVSDSLFPNGFHYSVLNRNDFAYGKYVRVDSQFVYYYNSSQQKEIPFFKINGKKGDTTYADNRRVIISAIDTMKIFNETTRIIHYRIDELSLREVSLSDKFGLIKASLYSDPPPPWPDYVYNSVGCKINGIKYGFTLSVEQYKSILSDFILYQNYPNPFNPATSIEFSLPYSGFVQLNILDYLGRNIVTLMSQYVSDGMHKVNWNAGNYASGIYYYQLIVGNKSETKKLVLLR